jgi:phosphate/sulfate permease
MILGWIIFSFVVGFVGSGRNIGFWGAFFLSLILSPIIGLIIALVSKDKAQESYKQEILKTQKKQHEMLQQMQKTQVTSVPVSNISIADQLEKLKKLKEENYISEDEFQNLKDKIISSI